MTVDGNDSMGVKSSAQFVRGWQYALTFMCPQWLNDNRKFIYDKDIK